MYLLRGIMATKIPPKVPSCAPGSTRASPLPFVDRVLPVDEPVARRAAALHVPDPAPFRDALIGATALVGEMTVVTRNVRDFERFQGLHVLSPWT